jgi:hypothetical protein
MPSGDFAVKGDDMSAERRRRIAILAAAVGVVAATVESRGSPCRAQDVAPLPQGVKAV